VKSQLLSGMHTKISVSYTDVTGKVAGEASTHCKEQRRRQIYY